MIIELIILFFVLNPYLQSIPSDSTLDLLRFDVAVNWISPPADRTASSAAYASTTDVIEAFARPPAPARPPTLMATEVATARASNSTVDVADTAMSSLIEVTAASPI